MDLSKIKTNKEEFCRALIKEVINLQTNYRHIATETPWFRKKISFNKNLSAFHANYADEKEMTLEIKNAINVTNLHFNLNINEKYEDNDILNAILKVENYYKILN